MFTSKTKAKKIGMMMTAMAIVGGLSFGSPLVASPTAEAHIGMGGSAGCDYYPPDYVPVEFPTNVTKITISSYNRPYLIDKFPMQKVGTTKNFKTSKSRGFAEYTDEGIRIVEYTSRKAPKSSAIKKLPYGWKVSHFKGEGKRNGSHLFAYRRGSDDKYLYLDPYFRVEDVYFVDNNTVRATFFVPNETYLAEMVKLNKGTHKIKKIGEKETRIEEESIIAHYGTGYY